MTSVAIAKERQAAVLRHLHQHVWSDRRWHPFETLVHMRVKIPPIEGHIAAVRTFMFGHLCLLDMDTTPEAHNPFRDNDLWAKLEEDIRCLPWTFAAHVTPSVWQAFVPFMQREYIATVRPAYTPVRQNLTGLLFAWDTEAVRKLYLYGGHATDFDGGLVVPLHKPSEPLTLRALAGTRGTVATGLTEGVMPYTFTFMGEKPAFLSIENNAFVLNPPASTQGDSGTVTVMAHDEAYQQAEIVLHWVVTARS